MSVTPDSFDHMTFAGLLGGAVALMKVLEKIFEWAAKKIGGEKMGVVDLAPEPTRMLRETYERVSDVSLVVTRVDTDGVPMVYTPRSFIENQTKMAEALRDMSKSQAEIISDRGDMSRKIEEILASIKKS